MNKTVPIKKKNLYGLKMNAAMKPDKIEFRNLIPELRDFPKAF